LETISVGCRYRCTGSPGCLSGCAALADSHLAGNGLELQNKETCGSAVERLACILVLAAELLGVVEGRDDLSARPVDGVEASRELLSKKLHDERHVCDELDGGHGVRLGPVLLGKSLGRELVERLANVHVERCVVTKVGKVVLRVPPVEGGVEIEELTNNMLGKGHVNCLVKRGDRDRSEVRDSGHFDT